MTEERVKTGLCLACGVELFQDHKVWGSGGLFTWHPYNDGLSWEDFEGNMCPAVLQYKETHPLVWLISDYWVVLDGYFLSTER